MEIKGKVAVITGAAGGMGRALSIELAKAGVNVVVSDINLAGAEKVKNELKALGRKALAVRADVTAISDVQELLRTSVKEMGQVDILVNNAGVHMVGPVEKTAIADWEWIFKINLWGVIHGIHVFLPYMLERRSGYFINVASMAGLIGGADPSIPYTTSKFAVMGLSEALAIHVANRGLGVTVVCPGFVATNISTAERVIEEKDGLDEARAKLRKIINRGFMRGEFPPFIDKSLFSIDSTDAKLIADPFDVAKDIIAAVREDRFMVTTHPGTEQLLVVRAHNIDFFIEQEARVRGEYEASLVELIKKTAAGEIHE